MPRRILFPTLLLLSIVVLPAGTWAEPSPTRILIQLRSHGDVRKGSDGRIHASSRSLEETLARSGALDAGPLFPPQGANLELRARLGMDRAFVIAFPSPDRLPEIAAELRAHPDIERVEPDHVGQAVGLGEAQEIVPNDTYFDQQWAFRNRGQNLFGHDFKPGADIKATQAWEITRGDSRILVAVLDTGIAYDHPDFAGRIWSNPGEIAGNGIDDDQNGYVDDTRGWNFAYSNNDPKDDFGHGTAVASVLGAVADNERGVAGLDWHSKIMPLKGLDSNGAGLYSWWDLALYYAANNGARVINMSVAAMNPDVFLQTALQYAHASGCFIVAAMGNNGQEFRYYPAGYDESVFAVGATSYTDARAGFSTYGAHIDVAAPGVLIYSLSRDPSYDAILVVGGTSLAAPMVSGLASLLLAQDPTRSPEALSQIIRASAEDLVGLPFEDTLGFDIYMGSGRINAFRALSLGAAHGAPVLFASAAVNATEGSPLSIPVAAADPEGDPILSLNADLSRLPGGHDAIFATNVSRDRGVLRWTPGYEDAGVYDVLLSAQSGARATAVSGPGPLESSVHVAIVVANTDRPPVVTAPSSIGVNENDEIHFSVTAIDPDGDALSSLSTSSVPQGATFTASAGGTQGEFRWTPTYDQAGLYVVTFFARDLLTGLAITQITVRNVDRPPLADAGGPYSGVVDVPIAFDGTHSTDPDGDAITFAWDFGDGHTGTGPSPVHAYSAGGGFTAVLTVRDGELWGSASAAVSIDDALPALAFPSDSDRRLMLASAKPLSCVQIQPENAAFQPTAVDLGSVRMISGGTGSVSSIPARAVKGSHVMDQNRDGIPEVTACFAKEDLRALFDHLSGGRQAIPVTLEGNLTTGGDFRGVCILDVFAVEGIVAAWLMPNPAVHASALGFKTSRAGWVTARLFDASGRLARVLCDRTYYPAGYHDLPLDTGGTGTRLRSGIYFYRLDTAEGSASGRFVAVR